ncbi:MAG: hypothetical protein HY873_13315 [Chloroflexi bacterium]|nr:hypothetical protein [Chloroflexota bacterium]
MTFTGYLILSRGRDGRLHGRLVISPPKGLARGEVAVRLSVGVPPEYFEPRPMLSAVIEVPALAPQPLLDLEAIGVAVEQATGLTVTVQEVGASAG